MEIINYTDKSSYAFSAAIRMPRMDRLVGRFFSGRRSRVSSAFTVRSHVHDGFTARELFVYARKARQQFVEAAYVCRRFLWLLPVCVAALVVPVLLMRAVDHAQGFARPVSFEKSDQSQYDLLNTVMSDFALDGAATHDRNGTVFSADGSAVVTDGSFKDIVTFSQYTVRAGDTISGISQKFGLGNISTLIAVNNIDNVRSLRSGQKLVVPSIDGLVHIVAPGESLNTVAETYDVSVEDLVDVNDLDSEILEAGVKLFVPGARLDSDVLRKAMGEVFSYPITARWRLTSRFGRRADPFTGVASNHTGIDMACPSGTPIYSALSGTVAYTGFSSVFGNYVIVKHYDGYQTLYGHMSKITTTKGASVSQGTKIGLVGSTGYSTGPHLHFTVYKNGKLVDPLTVLK